MRKNYGSYDDDGFIKRARTGIRSANEDDQSFRAKLGKFLESKKFQYFIIVLILVDVAVLVTELTLIAEEKGEEDSTITTVENALYWITVAILGIFASEIVGLLIAFGRDFFKHPLYIADLIIIASAIVLEVFLRESIAGFLTILRLWRVARIAHAIILAEEEKGKLTKEELERLREENKRLLAENEKLTNELYRAHV